MVISHPHLIQLALYMHLFITPSPNHTLIPSHRVSVVCTFGSLAAWFVWMIFIGSFPQFITDGTMYQVPMHVFVHPLFWLSVVMVAIACVGTNLAASFYFRTYLPACSLVFVFVFVFVLLYCLFFYCSPAFI